MRGDDEELDIGPFKGKGFEGRDASRLLIVGASGWVGSEISRVALSLPHWDTILGTGRNIEAHESSHPKSFRAHNLDLCVSPISVPEAEHMIYCAGDVPQSGKKIDSLWQPPALKHVLKDFFANGGKKAFVFSSGAVYESSELPNEGYKESQWLPHMGVRAHSDYGRVKQLEEIVVEEFREQGFCVGVGRLFAGLGPLYRSDSKYAFVDFIRQYRLDGAIRLLSPESRRSYVWFPNLAEKILKWLAMDLSESKTWNLTGRGTVTLRQLARGPFPEAQLIEGQHPPRDYFGNEQRMLELPLASGPSTSLETVNQMKLELDL